VIVEPTPEPEPSPEPAIENVTDEFHPQWWERLRASLRFDASKPRPPEVGEEAEALVEEESIPVQEEIPARPSNGIRSSGAMFAEVGAELWRRRVALNLTREEIERHLRVRASFLKALEEGSFDDLPSVVQTRGMLSNYAAFLDLDVDALLLRFADVLQVRHRERHPVPPGARGVISPNPAPSLPGLRSFLAADALGIVLVILLVAFLVWGVGRVVRTSSQAKAEPTGKSISEVLLEATALATRPVEATAGLLDLETTFTPETAATPVFTPTLPEGVNVQLNIVALERTFLRVTVDGKIAFDGRVMPGTAYPFEGQERIEILSGNAAAIQVTYNGRQLGILGNYGAVVNLIYSADGIFTPTATLVPTPTISLTPTITPSITATMVPSRTPTPP
jgi:cytoskeletal protein RodZ